MRSLKRRGRRVRVFFMDEARFGQQGTLTRKWARTGSRPTAVKQTRYEWVYLYAAVEPATGDSTAMPLPEVNTPSFNLFLEQFARHLGPRDHAVLVMDRAGWHMSKQVLWPRNVTRLELPPYSPELNPIENLWHYLKSHFLSNRVYADYDDVLRAGCDAWLSLTPERIRSVCACPYLTPETFS